MTIHKQLRILLIGSAILAVGSVALAITSLVLATHSYPRQPDPYGIWVLVNGERSVNNVSQLALDPLLNESASDHCQDMVKQNYWSHVNPQGKQPNAWIDAVGVKYKYWGENINYSYKTDVYAVDGFYASPEHKANTLNPNFTRVGIAVCSAPSYPDIVVEQFTGP